MSAVAASASALTSPELPLPHFRVAGDGDGVGKPQALLMQIVNPLPASVRTDAVNIAGPDAARFAVVANACRGVVLGPGQSCGLSVIATPTRPGTSRATLSLGGQGQPLVAPLAVTAYPTRGLELVRPAHGPAPRAQPRDCSSSPTGPPRCAGGPPARPGARTAGARPRLLRASHSTAGVATDLVAGAAAAPPASGPDDAGSVARLRDDAAHAPEPALRGSTA